MLRPRLQVPGSTSGATLPLQLAVASGGSLVVITGQVALDKEGQL